MFRSISSGLSFLVLLLIFSCGPASSAKNKGKLLKFNRSKNPVHKTKNPVHKTKNVKNTSKKSNTSGSSKPAPAPTPTPVPAPPFVATKLGEFPGNMIKDNTFQVTDEVFEFLKTNFKQPLSKITPFYIPTEVNVQEQENDFSYSVSEEDRGGKYLHLYDEDSPVENSLSKISILLDNFKDRNTNTVKVFGEFEIRKEEGDQKGNLFLTFGDLHDEEEVAGNQGGNNSCPGGMLESSDDSCYTNPVIFNSNNVAQSGKVVIEFFHTDENGVKTIEGKKEYDIIDDKEILQKLDLFRLE